VHTIPGFFDSSIPSRIQVRELSRLRSQLNKRGEEFESRLTRIEQDNRIHTAPHYTTHKHALSHRHLKPIVYGPSLTYGIPSSHPCPSFDSTSIIHYFVLSFGLYLACFPLFYIYPRDKEYTIESLGNHRLDTQRKDQDCHDLGARTPPHLRTRLNIPSRIDSTLHLYISPDLQCRPPTPTS